MRSLPSEWTRGPWAAEVRWPQGPSPAPAEYVKVYVPASIIPVWVVSDHARGDEQGLLHYTGRPDSGAGNHPLWAERPVAVALNIAHEMGERRLMGEYVELVVQALLDSTCAECAAIYALTGIVMAELDNLRGESSAPVALLREYLCALRRERGARTTPGHAPRPT